MSDIPAGKSVDGAQAPIPGGPDAAMLRCTRCGLSYLPVKSTSALKLTYCSFLCELGDLGFSMTGLENMERKRADTSDEAADAEVATGSHS